MSDASKIDDGGAAWCPVWHPVEQLDRSRDDTYMVRVENSDGSGIGPGWIDKGWFCDDDGIWYSADFTPLERGPWKVTAFAAWPDLADIAASKTGGPAHG